MDFGDDRGGGDGERERVAVVEAGLGAGVGELGEVEEHGVDEEVVGGDGEALDGVEHGEARGLVDVDAVDGFGIDFCDGDGEGHFADLAVEVLALLAGELLGVLEAVAGEVCRFDGEDDGRGYDGAEEASATDFVDASDEGVALVAERLLGCVGADELLEHLLFRSGSRVLGGGFGDAGDGGDGEEGSHGGVRARESLGRFRYVFLASCRVQFKCSGWGEHEFFANAGERLRDDALTKCGIGRRLAPIGWEKRVGSGWGVTGDEGAFVLCLQHYY